MGVGGSLVLGGIFFAVLDKRYERIKGTKTGVLRTVLAYNYYGFLTFQENENLTVISNPTLRRSVIQNKCTGTFN